jgi:quercetin dioxygenase-like cupin family protein
MKHPIAPIARAAFGLAAVAILGLLLPSVASAQQKLEVTPVVEKKVAQLPEGELFWQIETFPTLAEAEAAAGDTSLAAEVSGKVWLLTLGAEGAAGHGGTVVTEIGPVPRVTASEYLLRINRATGAPGAKTSIHSHPGPEAFYVLAGRMTQRTPERTIDLDAGQGTPGHGADVPMEVTSSGTVDLDQLVMFVVDATKPFSTPAKLD